MSCLKLRSVYLALVASSVLAACSSGTPPTMEGGDAYSDRSEDGGTDFTRFPAGRDSASILGRSVERFNLVRGLGLAADKLREIRGASEAICQRLAFCGEDPEKVAQSREFVELVREDFAQNSQSTKACLGLKAQKELRKSMTFAQLADHLRDCAR